MRDAERRPRGRWVNSAQDSFCTFLFPGQSPCLALQLLLGSPWRVWGMWVHFFFCSEDQPAQRINQEGGAVCLEEGAASSWCFHALLPYRSGSQNVFAQELVRESHSWAPLRLIKLAVLGMGPSNQEYNKPSRWLLCLTKVWEPRGHACALEALTYIQNT